MPRIRTLKPEFWQDEKLAPMPPLDRLVFIGLLSMADDAGRLLDNVKAIDGFLFPETEDTARESLDRLEASGRILRYRSDSGQKLLQIAGWAKHQKVDKPSKHVFPPPPTLATSPRESRESPAESSRSDLGPRTNDPDPDQSSSSPPRAWAEQEAAIAALLPTDDDRLALTAVVKTSPEPGMWCAVMWAALEESPSSGKRLVTPAQLGAALRDWIGNGAHRHPNLNHFRGYLRSAAQPNERDPPPGGRAARPGARPQNGTGPPAAPSPSPYAKALGGK